MNTFHCKDTRISSMEKGMIYFVSNNCGYLYETVLLILEVD